MKDAAMPVITIDGPSGAGKGTVSVILARRLGFHYLDSGALYRLLAVAAARHQVTLDNIDGLAVLAAHMDILFRMAPGDAEPSITLEGEDVTRLLRGEQIGAQASRIAAIPEVRAALLRRQRVFARPPGLVADGRDMGTVVFPDAALKVFLTASADERARRRYNQLIGKGETASLRDLVAQVSERDERDRTRPVAPLRPAEDATVVDSTTMTIDAVVEAILTLARERLR
ncbi:MAG: (d)CMP kinase [Gammaproteobacteria bacterium]|nr:(d)CMP kinase [Gammaproteobacteria bacterium]